jgi:arylsulfatase A-like enzyme
VGASVAAIVLIAAFVPVCLTLARGGADWYLTGDFRVSWYPGEGAAWAALVASLGVASLRPARRSFGSGAAFAGACLSLLCSAGILWTGGGRLGAVSFRHPESSVWLGLGLLIASFWGGARIAAGRLRVGVVLGLGLGVGMLVALGVERLDRLEIERALTLPSNGSRGTDAKRGSRALPGSDAPLQPGSQASDLVWIVVDTLRADALGAYRTFDPARSDPDEPRDRVSPDVSMRSAHAETPTLDRLAARGVVVERAFAPAPWTVPSMASVWTARHPSTLDPVGRGEAVEAGRLPALAPGLPSWIGSLRAAGYRTAGFQKNPFLGPGSGLEAPFDLYRVVGGDRAERDSGGQVVRAALRWADSLAAQRASGGRAAGGGDPYLLYVHFMDPHIDYRAPERWRAEAVRDYTGTIDGTAKNLHARLGSSAPLTFEDRVHLRRLYAAEVAYLDAAIGRLLEGLRERALLDDSTLVVVTSDHGEQFGEHGGWEHGDLHVENVHVPWILAGHGLAPGRVSTPLSTLDVGPTILELLGIPALPGAEGVGRAARLRGDEGAAELPAAIVTEYGQATRWVEDPWVLIEGADGRVELFDSGRDPAERKDLSAAHPARVEAMRARLANHREREHGPEAVSPSLRDPDAETREGLRALGYEW